MASLCIAAPPAHPPIGPTAPRVPGSVFSGSARPGPSSPANSWADPVWCSICTGSRNSWTAPTASSRAGRPSSYYGVCHRRCRIIGGGWLSAVCSNALDVNAHQDGDAAHGGRDRAYRARAARPQHVDRRAHHQPGGCGAQGGPPTSIRSPSRHVSAERRGRRSPHRRLRRAVAGSFFQIASPAGFSTRRVATTLRSSLSADLLYVTAWTIITCWPPELEPVLKELS